ncbi:MAG: hypothetical protein CMJ49_14360 [Planctomycetaceae bacterium]|nr:hypothetical protein [Planctomycetaceae bacterium]
MRKRVAVVGGSGAWGRKYLRAYAARSDCRMVALVDRHPERRRLCADFYGIENVFDSLEALFEREIPDIVSIIVPVPVNPGLVLACAEAGVKAVSCEKPIAVQLSVADEVVRICTERGSMLSCGNAFWEMPNFLEIVDWIHAGNIGRVTGIEISRGVPHEIAGGACPDLVMVRHILDSEAVWVEGHALPHREDWTFPDDTLPEERDGPMHGRIGYANGVVCEIPPPREDVARLSVHGENGHVFFQGHQPALIQGKGHEARMAYLKSLAVREDWHYIPGAIERVVRSFETGQTPLSNGHDYRQALEIAIAMKLSDKQGHERVALPLSDRSARIFPEPYRYHGGDGMELDSHTDMRRIERELNRWSHG